MSTEGRGPAITPDTKVGDLLAAWPHLEEVLIGISPAYKALRNPVLRRTVAKVATLRQVARVGNVPLGKLIDELRAAAGTSGAPLEAFADEGDDGTQRPDWARPERVKRSFDARVLIEEGGHPMPQVMSDLAALGADEVYELVTPFEPAPLVQLARQKGFQASSAREAPELVKTWFRPAPSQS
jgi:hypothetical protein